MRWAAPETRFLNSEKGAMRRLSGFTTGKPNTKRYLGPSPLWYSSNQAARAAISPSASSTDV